MLWKQQQSLSLTQLFNQIICQLHQPTMFSYDVIGKVVGGARLKKAVFVISAR